MSLPCSSNIGGLWRPAGWLPLGFAHASDLSETRDLEVGIAQGRFVVPHVEVARDLALGALVYGIGTMLRPGAPADYPEQVILAVLRALGLNEAEAAALATAPLPQTHAPQGVIFERIGANPQPD
ncbi:hypothetical protein CO2235_MP10295 [Cupriavidus oxalaticus]|uniref:Tetracyclin repressor-like 40 C-terminal domain-containing protein n=1 Tax=Cupriavidus oxalaticus TaxID=96344 RepID=A0A375G9H0_9BURK|nr:hypothetical protein CO2235_U1010137 [Cupriavidus oxalaticus]SPC18011.1 hypothetical protein CO2235_MP10295 [Cupriavidus oxalaticus]